MARRDHAWTRATFDGLKAIAATWQGEWLQVTDTAADRVDDCPSQALGGEFPGWNSVRAARQIGLAAAQTKIADPRLAVREAMRSLLGEADETRTMQRVQDWLVTLSHPARLDVADEALRWLVAWRSICPDAPESSFLYGGALRCTVTDNVSLRINIDLCYREPGSVDHTALVSLGGPPDHERDRAAAARVALVMWLRSTSVATVLVAHPAARSIDAFDVDLELVSLGAEQFRSAMRVVTRQASGVEEAPAIAGPQCRWCDKRSDCAVGRSYLEAQPRLVGGLPLG